MDSNEEIYYQKCTDYVVERATAEGSILRYYEQDYGDKMTFQEFIYRIVMLSDEFLEFAYENLSGFGFDDECAYVIEKSGFSSKDTIELALWFKLCLSMRDGCMIEIADCPECGHGELYEREAENGEMHHICLECASCGKKYDFEDIHEIDYDLDLELEMEPYKEPDPLEGLNPEGLPVFTDRDAIYRFRVSRKIIELFGTETLADFSYAIQQLFELDYNRMSSFYMGKKFFDNRRAISCPRIFPFGVDEPSTAQDYEICSLNLYENQKFLYLHNFINENRFNIRFIGVR